MKTTISKKLARWFREKIGGTHRHTKNAFADALKRRKSLSPAQTITRGRFYLAVEYAKAQMCDPEMRALYQSRINRRNMSAYGVAVTDALNAPDVRLIDDDNYRGGVGDVITIRAWDDFMVARVRVILSDTHGTELERGEAIQDRGNIFMWKYTATRANRTLAGTTITATAFDFPGNQASLQKTLTSPQLQQP